jgi:thiol-disulfide isomerase/thioredoxin
MPLNLGPIAMRRIILFCSTLLALAACGYAADVSHPETADELWDHIGQLEEAAPVSDRAQQLERLENLRGALLEFETRFTTDPRRWDAKLTRVQVESDRAQRDNRQPDMAALLALVKEIGAAPDALPTAKADARYLQAEVHIEALDSAGASADRAARAAAETDIAELRKNYPDDPRTAMMQFELAQILKLRDPGAAESILRELEASPDIHVAARAQQQMESLQSVRKLAKEPLDLKFRAVDGKEVNLAKLRGNVVLVDFWATWCGPCRAEIPHVVAAYNQLHKDGFEVVGVSLDQDKERMLSFIKNAGMTWPEYFDGKTWGNEISARFGIKEIPTAWLVDKKGFVRSTEARGVGLAEQVRKLLAE